MNNHALVAALGADAAAAVRGYRRLVVAEARRRGLRLVVQPLSEPARPTAGAPAERNEPVDPIDIRLVFRHCPARVWLAGRTLCWSPAVGWSASHWSATGPLAFYAGVDATPLQLVPVPVDVVRWASGAIDGAAVPPAAVELDDDPRAVQRLLGFGAATQPDPISRRTG